MLLPYTIKTLLLHEKKYNFDTWTFILCFTYIWPRGERKKYDKTISISQLIQLMQDTTKDRVVIYNVLVVLDPKTDQD
jgi:hypothetical protein